MKIPTVNALRRWKRDALEQQFELKALVIRFSGDAKTVRLLENLAMLCAVMIDHAPTFTEYDRIKAENVSLRQQLEILRMKKNAHSSEEN